MKIVENVNKLADNELFKSAILTDQRIINLMKDKPEKDRLVILIRYKTYVKEENKYLTMLINMGRAIYISGDNTYIISKAKIKIYYYDGEILYHIDSKTGEKITSNVNKFIINANEMMKEALELD